MPLIVGSGDWQWALSIAGRFSLPGSGISPLRVAQEIVSEFREQLEQAEAAENVFSTSNSSSPAGNITFSAAL